MRKITRTLLAGAAVWIGSALLCGLACRQSLSHPELQFSTATMRSAILLFATLNLLVMCAARVAHWLAASFCQADRLLLRILASFAAIWIAVALTAGAILRIFSQTASLPLSFRTLMLLTIMYATGTALLAFLWKYRPRTPEDTDYDDDWCHAPAIPEQSECQITLLFMMDDWKGK